MKDPKMQTGLAQGGHLTTQQNRALVKRERARKRVLRKRYVAAQLKQAALEQQQVAADAAKGLPLPVTKFARLDAEVAAWQCEAEHVKAATLAAKRTQQAAQREQRKLANQLRQHRREQL